MNFQSEVGRKPVSRHASETETAIGAMLDGFSIAGSFANQRAGMRANRPFNFHIPARPSTHRHKGGRRCATHRVPKTTMK
jgi:hypothetical protein